MNAPSVDRREREYKRLRAYEGLLVFVVIVLTTLAVAAPALAAITGSLRAVARSISASP